MYMDTVIDEVDTELVPITTVQSFKDEFLFGVDITDSNGNSLSDAVINSKIQQSISFIETIIDCPIYPKKFEERIDYNSHDFSAYGYVVLKHRPIITNSIESFGIEVFGNVKIFDIPKEWFVVDYKNGQIQIKPNFAGYSTGGYASLVFSLIPFGYGSYVTSSNAANYPGMFRVIYKAGLANEDRMIAPIINRAIGNRTAVSVLQMLGDIGPGGKPGITAQSLSIDGMSQSTSTAISATNNLFGATVSEYNREWKDNLEPLLRQKYRKQFSINFV